MTTVQNFTLSELIATSRKVDKGISLEELKGAFYAALENKEAILKEINKTYTVAQISHMIILHEKKKSYAVDRLYDVLLNSFRILERCFTYSPFEEKYIDVLKRDIESQTQADIDANIERIRVKREERQKTLSNPETLEEFRNFIYYKGKDKLTPEQLQKYEELTAEQQLKIKALEESKKSEVKAVSVDAEFIIHETVHTIKGHKLFVVKLSDRVERAVFNDLNSKAKKLNGYYSSYAKNGAIAGFTFTEEENAKKFMELKNGDQVTEKFEEKKEAKEENTVNKFTVMAESLEAKGKEKLNQPRQSNTHRRAAFAASAEADAVKMLSWAKILKNIAEKLDNNELKYLSKVSSLSQLEELKRLLNSGYYKRIKQENISSQKEEERTNYLENLKYVEFPEVKIYKNNFQSTCLKLSNKPGQKRRAEKFLRDLKYTNDGEFMVINRRDIPELKALIMDMESYEQKNHKESIASLERLLKMNIDTIELLKMALREFVACISNDLLSDKEKQAQKIKSIERALIGQKIDGFFPTPEAVVNRMIDEANINESDYIIEPSAGLGHIADKIKESYPNNILNVVECVSSLRDALEIKGHSLLQTRDFLEVQQSYDKIIMNPPFENCQDIRHVMHAYSLLNEGGRIVAIMSEGPFFRSQKMDVEFRNWLESVGGYSEKLPEKSFESAFRPTGVNTRLVIIHK
jgi:hypothetical protein